MHGRTEGIRIDFIPYERYHRITSFRGMYLESHRKGVRYERKDF